MLVSGIKVQVLADGLLRTEFHIMPEIVARSPGGIPQAGLSETLPVLRQIPKSLFKLERLQPSPISILIRADGVIMNDRETGNRAESLLIGINISEGGT